jgi:NADH-quinone oxidoreductase subunit H
VIAPAIVMVAALMGFVVIPFAPGFMVSDLNIGVLFFLATSSMGAYSIILGGWASNNKYALLGAMRGAAQMISYEVFMGLSIMGVVLLSGSFSLHTIVEAQAGMWYVVPQFAGFVIFFIAGIAETHRLPFDIPESESEIIAGFHSEYSGMKFGMFFVGEYVGIILISSMTVALYFGGWLGPDFLPPVVWFILKTFFFIFVFILLRASLPRPRYDQLMDFGWKILLPITIINLMVTAAIVLYMEKGMP